MVLLLSSFPNSTKDRKILTSIRNNDHAAISCLMMILYDCPLSFKVIQFIQIHLDPVQMNKIYIEKRHNFINNGHA
ncbi:hypothetical protein EUGRSUZ_I01320 [Eucalyptus grandis]|uniref:Uncharacterized protein n=2 Tax=Eucalyptus grandis TaxID=71139 RepID=A0ACC3JED1_EUCGR|nr:hypothetical protein EUGRSUZ_I01320 [Eucalyptus grandis]